MQEYKEWINDILGNGSVKFPKEQSFETEKLEEKLSIIEHKPIHEPTGDFEDFKSFCKMGRIDSEGTVKVYWEIVKRCSKYSGKDILDVTAEDINDFLRHCQDKLNYKTTSLKNTYFALAKFHRDYLGKKGIDELQIRDKIVKKKKLNYLRPKEQQTIMIELMKRRDAEGLTRRQQLVRSRDYLIFTIGMDCGLRVSEIVNLKRSDVNWDMQELDIINGKGNKDRIVPFSNRVKEALEHYLALRYDDLDCLLVNHSDKSIPKEFKIQGVQKRIKRICSALEIRMDGIESKATVHWLRHTFGTNAVRRGMRLDILKDLMGHSSIATTERYLHAEDNEKRQAYHQLFG